MQFASFNALRAELRMWEATMSDVGGCVNLSRSSRAQPRMAITDADAPELMLLEYPVALCAYPPPRLGRA